MSGTGPPDSQQTQADMFADAAAALTTRRRHSRRNLAITTWPCPACGATMSSVTGYCWACHLREHPQTAALILQRRLLDGAGLLQTLADEDMTPRDAAVQVLTKRRAVADAAYTLAELADTVKARAT
jgi:hypothetical protein